MKESIIADKSYAFAVKIVKLHLRLCQKNSHSYHISKQLMRAGTSIAANAEEANGGHSGKDFSAKMSIAYKEARETKYWLRLLNDTGLLDPGITAPFLEDVEEILKITGSIIKTMKRKNAQPSNS